MSAAATVWSDWDGGFASAGITTAAGLSSASEALGAALGRALSVDEERLARELMAAYASEINVRVACVDGAWTGAVGDERTASELPLRALLDWLPAAVCRSYPHSDFARSYVTSRR